MLAVPRFVEGEMRDWKNRCFENMSEHKTCSSENPLVWQQITLAASEGLAVYIPYFIQDPGSMRAQNGTVLDMDAGERLSMNILFPPRNDAVVFFIGEIGRTEWPIRPADVSWVTWLENPTNGSAVQAIPNEDLGGVWPWLVPGNSTGGDVIPLVMETVRPARSDLTEADGVGASDGWVNGRDVYDWVDFIADDTPCASCGMEQITRRLRWPCTSAGRGTVHHDPRPSAPRRRLKPSLR